MNILLINPPGQLKNLLGAGEIFVPKYEPLGLLYIAAVIKKSGYAVTVIDSYAEGLSLEDLKTRILNQGPDIVGISTLTCNGAISYKLGQWLKRTLPNMLVVLGNIHAQVYAKQYLENGCCDIVVHGEGEYTFLEIIKSYEKKLRLGDIPAISFLDANGTYCKTPGSAIITDLEKLPFPSRDLVNPNLYNLTEISNQLYIGGRNTVAKTMSTSRGCPYRCTFCVVHANNRQRFNSAIRVVEEMGILEKEYGASYVTIVDPLFIGNKQRLFAICSEIKKRGLKIKWGCDAHIHLITPDLIEEVESAGCYELDFGIESGVQRLLDIIRKGTTIQQIKEAIYTTKKYSRIHISGLFILGLPTETYKDSLETIRFAKSLPLDMAQFSILTPYPGSPLFNELSEKGQIDTGIRKDGSMDISVWERYSSYISFTDNNPIWVTPELSHTVIKRLQKKAQREFYLRPSQIIKHLRRVRADNLFELIKVLLKAFVV